MTVIPFPPPPPPTDRFPTFDMYDLNEQQFATLAMMGLDELAIIDRHMVPYYVEAGGDEAGQTPSIAVSHILKHHAPVVLHLGRRKAITIDGDITTLDGPRRVRIF